MMIMYHISLLTSPLNMEEFIHTNTQMTPTQVTVFTWSAGILLISFCFSYGTKSSKRIQSHLSCGLQCTQYGLTSRVGPGKDVRMKSNLLKSSWKRHTK